MAWTTTRDESGRLLLVTGEGRVSAEEAFAQVAEGIEIILREDIKGAMIDYSAVILEMPITDIYKMPELFEAQGLPRKTRIAVVLPGDPANMHKYTFFDDVATNRGYIVKLFWETSAALAWLAAV